MSSNKAGHGIAGGSLVASRYSQLAFRDRQYDLTSHTDAITNMAEPTNIIKNVTLFGPGHDAAKPTKQVLRPKNAVATVF